MKKLSNTKAELKNIHCLLKNTCTCKGKTSAFSNIFAYQSYIDFFYLINIFSGVLFLQVFFRIPTLTYTTLFQRWFNGALRRGVIST